MYMETLCIFRCSFTLITKVVADSVRHWKISKEKERGGEDRGKKKGEGKIKEKKREIKPKKICPVET